MSEDDFFKEQSEQSRIKTAIVNHYFKGWASIMIRHLDRDIRNHGSPIQYIDMFAGPGRYDDGHSSTPLVILETALSDAKFTNRLFTSFNEKKPEFAEALRRDIDAISGIEKLRYPPAVTNFAVGKQIVDQLRREDIVPTLFFVDPWGYKGLSLELIDAALRSFGCDGIFFFSYDRINRTFGKDTQGEIENLRELFGQVRADSLRERLKCLSAEQREFEIISEITSAIESTGKFVLPFRFKKDSGRTSHHLIFASKGFKGYELMRKVMAEEGLTDEDGVPAFEYNPVDARQPKLFQLRRPIADLEEMLLETFAGRTLNVEGIYQPRLGGFNVGKPYIEKNYKTVLLGMEQRGIIIMNPSKRRSGTLGKDVMITFPPRT